MSIFRRSLPAALSFLIVIVVTPLSETASRELTLNEAIEIAASRTSRAEIIRGNLEVAERSYFAERINFYVPEISVNGSLPAYSVNESFRFYGGLPQKELIQTTDFDFTGNIQLKQSLVSGGLLTVRGNLLRNRAEYPKWSDLDFTVDQVTRQGFFDFEFAQPFLKPSDAKNDLNNRRDELEIAKLTRIDELTDLKKEVAEAYFGALQLMLKTELTGDKLEAARLQVEIDSVKFQDGVISEENWLESASTRLDAELEKVDIDNQRIEKNRELAILLDFEATETMDPSTPHVGERLSDAEKKLLTDRWEESLDVLKAYYEYHRQQRAADYAASAHGLNGDIRAKYSLGRGKVKTEGALDDNIKTNSWEVSLDFTYPIWDGGASSAAVRAAQIAEEKAKIEYERAKRSARAEIINLINRLDVGYRKLEVLNQQIQLAKNKLDIARFRFEDGQISEVKYLESKVGYLEAQDKYLEELKNYLLDRITLEGKYSG